MHVSRQWVLQLLQVPFKQSKWFLMLTVTRDNCEAVVVITIQTLEHCFAC